MKTHWIAALAIGALLTLPGCGDSGTSAPASSAASTSTPTQTNSTRVIDEATPARTEEVAGDDDDHLVLPPPAKPDANTIPWEQAKQLIRSCKVRHMMQPHSGQVEITLTDGRHVNTIEPNIDDVLEIEGDSDCPRIAVAVE